MNTELSKIIDDYWNDYVKHRRNKVVVNPSIPIIWFGDMDAYFKSKLKIVTIALNPSKAEFETTNNVKSFFRFNGGDKLYCKNKLSKCDKDMLAQTLNNYFSDNGKPYKEWFDHFEKRLKIFNASYYRNNEENTAIHIDIYSSLATDPTWGKIGNNNNSCLKNICLFNELFDYLKPDIVFYSANANALKEVFGLGKKDILENHQAKPGIAINVYEYKYQAQPGISKNECENKYPTQSEISKNECECKNILIISGRNMWGTPFGGMSDAFIDNAMNDIKKKYNL